MSTQIQRRRGTTAEHSTFTGADGELTVDTTKDTVVVHDATTVGGHPLQKQYPPLGSAAAPTYTFTGDTNTGIYSPGADQWAVATGGTGRLFVDASGNVGVSTSSPGAKFHVNAPAKIGEGAASNTSKLLVNTLAGTAAGIQLFQDATESWIIQNPASSTDLTFSNSSTERLRITSAGLVGIGTSAVDAKFHVAGDSTDGTQARITGATNQNYQLRWGFDTTNLVGRIQSIHAGTAYKALALNPDGGSVGIGTASPAYNLEVAGTSTVIASNGSSSAQVIAIDSKKQFSGLRMSGDVARLETTFFSGAGGGYTPLTFWTSDTERARIDSSGRLLVGTSTARTGWYNTGAGVVTPLIQLDGTDVNNSTISVARNTTTASDDGRILFGRSRGTTAGSFTLVASNDALGQISFQGADGSELVEAASIRAEVDGTPGANDMPGRLVFSTTADGASTPTERMRITNGGRILVGITSATTISADARLQTSNFAVEVAGDYTGSWWNRTDSTAAWVAQRFHAQGSLSGFIQVNTSSVTYSTTSDHRLKENVTPVSDGLSRLQQLKPSRFNFIANPSETVDGFLAHEVQTIVPEAITGEKDEVDADGNPVYQGIDQSKLVPLLTAALQEAIGRIETLEAEVAALKAS